MPIWARTTPDVVLDRLVSRLTDPAATNGQGKPAATGFTVDTCFIGTRSPELIPTASDLYATVHLEGGTFDEGHLDGGGRSGGLLNGSLVVTLRSTVVLDDAGRRQAKLTHGDLGLYLAATKVLVNLTAHDLLGANGQRILAQPILPHDFQIPPDAREVGELSLSFSCLFVWDLGG